MITEPLPVQSKETWSVSVLYEDTTIRERAMLMCDHLMRQFWSDIEFDFNWWRFSFLNDPVLAQQAARHATDADVIIIAVRAEGDLGTGIRTWLEQAVERRGVREGAFIALFCGDQGELRPAVGRKDDCLRALARKAGMDYFTEAPRVLPGSLPTSLDTYSHRAEQTTSVMEEILRRTPPARCTF